MTGAKNMGARSKLGSPTAAIDATEKVRSRVQQRALDAPHGKEWVHVDVLPSVLMPRKMRATTGGLVEELFEKTNERVDSHG